MIDTGHQLVRQLNWRCVSKQFGPRKSLAAIVLPLWFLLALSCSVLGVFDTQQSPPLLLGAAATLPVVAFVIWYRSSPAFRRVVLGANLRILTLAQTWRVGGILFVILNARGVLPAVFALPAGWGDFAVGVTAPLVTWAITAKVRFPKRIFVLWNALGILDLVMAVSLGVLASPSPLGILAGEITTKAMGMFPLSLIPTFFVPLLAILHLISLIKVRHEKLTLSEPL